jgi:hypothetical protein
MMRMRVPLGALVVVFGFVTACSDDSGAGLSLDTPADEWSTGEFEIEESDLYRYDGSRLYVQNAQTGLNIVDVADPTNPRLLGQASVVGKAGELYVRQTHAILLLEEPTAACQMITGCEKSDWQYGSELVFVGVADPQKPKVEQRYCLPGTLVNSRIVGDFLYVITNAPSQGSQAISISLANPALPQVVQQMHFPQASKEIHVTTEAIFVAGDASVDPANCSLDTCDCDSYRCRPKALTDLQYIEISAATGQMIERGALKISGKPQGRFHMSAFGQQFRIVTLETRNGVRATRLSILNISDPDNLSVMGKVEDIGKGEALYATRFTEDGRRAYVVTFRQTDPLWVIDLENPTSPKIVGELFVPGWSDYIFPRGDTLLTVGRGDGGRGLGISLFDVSDPSSPRSLDQVTLGLWGTTSEANTDHRAVTIVEPPGKQPMVILPFATYEYDSRGYNTCERVNRLQLVDVNAASLRVRGMYEQQGFIRRTLMAGEVLMSISDYEILSLDVSDRDAITAHGNVVVGNQFSLSTVDELDCHSYDESEWYWGGCFGGALCQLEKGIAGREPGVPVGPIVVLMLGVTYFIRRRPRT